MEEPAVLPKASLNKGHQFKNHPALLAVAVSKQLSHFGFVSVMIVALVSIKQLVYRYAKRIAAGHGNGFSGQHRRAHRGTVRIVHRAH